MASQNNDYVSISGGVSKISTITSNGNTFDRNRNDGTSVTLSLGHRYESGRFNASYTYVDHDSDSVKEVGAFNFAYDFMFPLSTSGISLFVGPTLGYSWYEDNSVNLSGLHYGGELGMTYDVFNNWSIELGYKYFNETASKEGTLGEVEYDDFQTLYIGVNYYFSY
jgi:opacity protein-like surface antigen